MKVFATFVLVLAGLVPTHAESIPVDTEAILVIPDGSQITGSFTLPAGTYNVGPTPGVNFQFADGTGTAVGEFNDGDQGTIHFTTPLTSLTVNWIAGGTSFFSIFTNDGQGFTCEYLALDCTSSGTFTATGGITSLTWTTAYGYGGPDSISYALDGPVVAPEPATLLLLTVPLLLGLMRWAQMSLRKLSVRQRLEQPQTP